MVTADRIPTFNDRRVDEREGAQLISREYIRAQLSTTLADALRKTTSVQVDEEAGNQGSIVSIRGMQGDGVSVRVDGAPQNFNQVRHGGANMIWTEPDIYKTIAVIPGVASNIYGNGSIGGVIKLETIDPKDLLQGNANSALNLQARPRDQRRRLCPDDGGGTTVHGRGGGPRSRPHARQRFLRGRLGQ